MKHLLKLPRIDSDQETIRELFEIFKQIFNTINLPFDFLGISQSFDAIKYL